MSRAPQKRRLVTRARLLDAAQELIARNGHDRLRVEEVVAKAGVAKGTFFSHFKDKDNLLSELIGAQMHNALEKMAKTRPETIADMVAAHRSYFNVIAQNRTTVDITVRYSGAAAIEDLGPITMAFGRHLDIMVGWMKDMPEGHLRTDLELEFLAEGIQAFAVQAIALKFCALHSSVEVLDRFAAYLRAWLAPSR